jgi:thiamine kinase-like enzyme
MPDELAATVRVLGDIEAVMKRDPVPDVACHNDLLSENFIIDAAGKMWVIDWEYGGMTDPYFDLGDFVMEHPFSREEQRLIISTYCEGMNERFFARMMLYRMVSGIWWAIWAMIQHTVSQIEFDYMEWGLERGVRRAHEVLDDPDYSKWLAEA